MSWYAPPFGLEGVVLLSGFCAILMKVCVLGSWATFGEASAAVVDGTTVAACLRNARAVSGWLAARGFGTVDRPVAVIAAGERWPDGSLRPCLEDLLGAGAVIDGLDASPSPEAAAARSVFRGTSDVVAAVRECGGGLELVAGGFASDVDVAVEVDRCVAVPVLADGAFGA